MSTSVLPRPMSVNPSRQQLEELDELLKRMLELPGVEEEAAAESAPIRLRGGRPSDALGSRSTRPGRPVDVLAVARASSDASVPEARPGYTTPEAASAPAEDDEPPQVPEFQPPNPDDWIKLAATWQPSPVTWGPLAETWKQSARTLPQAPRVELVAEEPAVSSQSSKLLVPPIALEIPQSSPLRVAEEPRPAPPPAPSKAPGPPSRDEVVSPEWEEVTASYLWLLVVLNKVFDVGLLLFGPLGEWLKGHKGRNLLGGVGMVCLALAVAYVATDSFGYLEDLQVWLGDWFGWTR